MRSLMIIFFGVFFISTGQATPLDTMRPWMRISTPLIMSTTFKYNFNKLPSHGGFEGDQKMWSGDYWPLNKGNINYRWNAPEPRGFNLKSPSASEVASMSPEQLAILSPSEKFDLLNGRFTYPLKKDVNTFAYPAARDWEGLCHGWAPATMNHKEHHPKVALNPQGQNIPFGSADIKALLSYYYAYKHKVATTHQMGRRCSRSRYRGTCGEDMNAGAFHIVLTNKLGLDRKTFIADMDNGYEVWNHPLESYVSTIVADNLSPRSSSASRAVKLVRMKTEVKYLIESEKNTWAPILGTELQLNEEEEFEYYLDVDARGNIVGGDWISTNRPDFLWLVAPATKFEGAWARLGELLNDGP